MKSKLLVATTAAALAAGTYYAVAQGTQNAPSASQSTQSGAMDKGASSDKGKADRGAQMKAPEKSEQAPGTRPSTSGQAPSSSQSQSGASPSPKSGAESSSQTQRSQSPSSSGSKSDTQRSPSAAQSGSSSQSPSGSSAQAPAASGAQGGGTASLTTQQRTEIRSTVLAQRNAPRVASVNFSLSVGTVVPRSVKVVAVPETIVRIHPAWRGYMYFLVGDQIVIVEPGSLRIVAVIA
jgi:hypothetical protein